MMVNIVLGETVDAAGVQVPAYGFTDENQVSSLQTHTNLVVVVLMWIL